MARNLTNHLAGAAAAGRALSAARLVMVTGWAAPGRDPRLILGQRPAHRASRGRARTVNIADM